MKKADWQELIDYVEPAIDSVEQALAMDSTGPVLPVRIRNSLERCLQELQKISEKAGAKL